VKKIEIEFGFRFLKADMKVRVSKMASAILFLRKTNKELSEQRTFDEERIRDLELQIADLDYKLRG